MTIHPKYRPDIDGLRAIAVGSVVIFHAFPSALPGGFLGVDIFFVISGYLITNIILGDLSRNCFSFVDFYARRIKRIFPALILVLVTTIGIGWFVLSAAEYKQLGKHVFAGGTFLSNFALLRESGYFDSEGWSKPLLNLWSLGVEEQFYIFWPLLLYIAWQFKFRLFHSIAVIAILSLLLNVGILLKNPDAAFYLPFTRFWELMLGGLLAYSSTAGTNLNGSHDFKIPKQSLERFLTLSARSFIGIILIVASVIATTKQTKFSGWLTLAPTIGTCLIISSGQNTWINRILLSSKGLVWIGLISYPLYLWHWPLLSFLHIIEDGDPEWIYRFAVLMVSVFLSWLTLLLWEKPIRTGNGNRAKIILLCGTVAGISLFGLYAYLNSGLPSRSGTIAELHKFETILQISSSAMNDSSACQKYKYGREVPECEHIDSDAPPTAAVVGDSHASGMYFALVNHYRRLGGNLISIRSCLILAGVTRLNNGRYECEMNDPGLEYLTRSSSIKTVILSARGVFNIEGKGFGDLGNEQFTKTLVSNSNPSLQNNAQVFLMGLRTYVEKLALSEKKVILVADIPELGFSPISCIDRPVRDTRRPCAVLRSEYESRNQKYLGILQQVQREFPFVEILRPSEYLCDSLYCWAMIGGKLLYGDDDHLSLEGSEYLASKLSPKF